MLVPICSPTHTNRLLPSPFFTYMQRECGYPSISTLSKRVAHLHRYQEDCDSEIAHMSRTCMTCGTYHTRLSAHPSMSMVKLPLSVLSSSQEQVFLCPLSRAIPLSAAKREECFKFIRIILTREGSPLTQKYSYAKVYPQPPFASYNSMCIPLPQGRIFDSP